MKNLTLSFTYDSLEKIINLPKGMKIVAAQDSMDNNCLKLKVVCEDEAVLENKEMVFDIETRQWNVIETKSNILTFYNED